MLKVDVVHANFTKLLDAVFKPDFIGASIPSPIENRRYTTALLVNAPNFNLTYSSELFTYSCELSAVVIFRLPARLTYSELPIDKIQPYIQYASESLSKLGILQFSNSDWAEVSKHVWTGTAPLVEAFTTVEVQQEVLLHESQDWLINCSFNAQSQWSTEEGIEAPLEPLPNDLSAAIIASIKVGLFRESLTNALTITPVPDGDLTIERQS